MLSFFEPEADMQHGCGMKPMHPRAIGFHIPYKGVLDAFRGHLVVSHMSTYEDGFGGCCDIRKIYLGALTGQGPA